MHDRPVRRTNECRFPGIHPSRGSVGPSRGGSMTTEQQPSTDAVRDAVATITGAAVAATSPESAGLIDRIIASAARLGVELDANEAEQWMSAVRTEAAGGEISVDVSTGVYGHRVTMLDYSPDDLARFREIGKIVGFDDRPPDVLTALSISGSAAQGKIQRFPGDCDFFERIHIRAASRAEAGRILAELMREKALATFSGPGYRLWEVKWGTHAKPVTYHGKPMKAGSPMSWAPAEVVAGQMDVIDADGTSRVIRWNENELEPGWCKLDWVVADHVRGSIANASNVLDPTWEAPDGSITPLDGFLDPYYQEVYLEAESIPLFSRLVKELGPDSVDD